MRETCSFDIAVIAGHNSSVVPSYDPETYIIYIQGNKAADRIAIPIFRGVEEGIEYFRPEHRN